MKQNNFYRYLLNSTARIYYLVWKDTILEEKSCHYFGYLNRVITCRYHRLSFTVLYKLYSLNKTRSVEGSAELRVKKKNKEKENNQRIRVPL